MKQYIGLKTINATPMNRGDYNKKRGWNIPENENPLDEGYLVEYPDGYISWSPKHVFEEAYKERTAAVELQHDLLTTKYTRVLHEKDFEHNAPHHFEVWGNVGEQSLQMLSVIDFQKGPIKEYGVNGVCNEDLIAMVISRLEHFQRSEFSCRENQLAITKFEEGLLWLRKRTMGRENRGVEGMSVK